MNAFVAYIRDQRATSAVEFALIIPVAAALILSLLHMSLVLYSANNLHFATEETARCLAVSANNPSGTTTPCPPGSTATQIQSYGVARYVGPNISPAFSVGASAACANALQVSATGTYNMFMGFVSFPIGLSAAACYPHS